MIDAEFLISYDLAKKVPDMRSRGFTIETAYGDIAIDSTEAEPFVHLVEALLERRRLGC